MKKMHVFLSAAVLAAGIGFSTAAQAAEPAQGAKTIAAAEVSSVSAHNAAAETMKGKVVAQQVIELPTFTEVDYEKGLTLDSALFDHYGCSAIMKKLSNGDTIVGRSMDLYYSHKPAYIVRTAVPGYLKTVGLAYNPFIGKTFDVVEKEGLTAEDTLPILFFTTDIMNEKGLYIEGNMRPGQPKEAGFADSSGTNPGAEWRMSFAGLIRFLGERAGSVEEAVALAKTVDVYGMKTDHINWTGALYMADASGHHGVLELVDNKLSWCDGEVAQTNFFLTPEYREKQVYGSGVGRYERIVGGIGDVKTEDDMMNLISKVSYSQLIMKDEWTFDPRSDFTTDVEHPALAEFGGTLTLKAALDEKNREVLYEKIRELGRAQRVKSIDQLKDEGTQWLSVFQLVANCNRKNIHVMFFEDPETIRDITL